MGQGGNDGEGYPNGNIRDYLHDNTVYRAASLDAGEDGSITAVDTSHRDSDRPEHQGIYTAERRSKGVLDVPTPTPTALATAVSVRDMQTKRTVEPANVPSLATEVEGRARPRGTEGEAEDTTAVVGTTGIICSYPWPQGCDYWLGVASCESTYRERVVVRAWPYGYYVGWFQIWTGHGYTIEHLQDGANNVQATWELSDQGQYTGAWPVCQWQS